MLYICTHKYIHVLYKLPLHKRCAQSKQWTAACTCIQRYTCNALCSIYTDTLTNGATVAAQLAGLNQHMHKQIIN